MREAAAVSWVSFSSGGYDAGVRYVHIGIQGVGVEWERVILAGKKRRGAHSGM